MPIVLTDRTVERTLTFLSYEYRYLSVYFFIDDFAHNFAHSFRGKSILFFETIMTALKQSSMKICYVAHVSECFAEVIQCVPLLLFYFLRLIRLKYVGRENLKQFDLLAKKVKLIFRPPWAKIASIDKIDNIDIVCKHPCRICSFMEGTTFVNYCTKERVKMVNRNNARSNDHPG